MWSFFSSQGSGAPAPAPAPSIAASGQQLASTSDATSTPKPAASTVPLIAANNTLEQDKETVLRCWLAMGGEEDVLRRKYFNEEYDSEDEGTDQDEEEYLMRDEPSDDVSEWCGVTVEEGRVTKLFWGCQGLIGIILRR